MADPDDKWPKYNHAKHNHLHAIGVIAHSYNSFEEGMFSLYRHHLCLLKVRQKLIEVFYLSLNEQQRLAAIKVTFSECEKAEARKVADSLVDYFAWCWDVRNKLIHAELYPASFGANLENLHLMKRLGKKTMDRGYLELELQTIRDLADKIEHGIRQCAGFQIWLRVRDGDKSSWLKPFADEPLPEILVVPAPLELSLRPQKGPIPAPRQKS